MTASLRSILLGIAAGSALWLLSLPFSHAAGEVAGALFIVANTFVCLDVLDLLFRINLIHVYRADTDAGAHEIAPRSALPDAELAQHVQRYALLLSVRDMGDAVHDLMEALAPWREHTWIIDDASSDHTAQRLRHAGWRCLSSLQNRKKPGAIHRLLHELPAEIETVMVLDPDCAITLGADGQTSTLERCLYEFHRSGAAAFCPSIGVRTGGVLGQLQEFEYALSLAIGRRSLAGLSVVSGVSIYRRARLEAALLQHSHSVYAEDLENSLLLLAHGEQIYFDDRLQIDTEAKQMLGAWFSQRVGWSFGLVKVYFERFREVLDIARRGPFAAYHYLVYVGLFSIALLPLKLVAAAVLLASFFNGIDSLFGFDLVPDYSWSSPILFADVFCKYLAFVALATAAAIPKGRRLALLPTVASGFLFYVMLGSVAFAVGFANWFALRLFGRRVYRDHYDDDPRLLAPRRSQTGPTMAGEPA